MKLSSLARDSNLLMLIKDNAVAEKFLKFKELFVQGPIKCWLHTNLNCCKGTIYAPYLIDIPEEEIKRELKEEGVIDIYKFKRNLDGKSTASGVMFLTFDKYHVTE